MTTDTNIAYAAGIIDGEGNISVLRRIRPKLSRLYHYLLQVQVSQSESPILDWLAKTFGGKVNKYHQYAGSLKPTSSIYHWRLCGDKAKSFIVLVEPYLIRNKYKARLARNYPTNRTKNHLTEEEWQMQAYIREAMKGG